MKPKLERKVEIEQDVRTGEVITANGVPLTQTPYEIIELWKCELARELAEQFETSPHGEDLIYNRVSILTGKILEKYAQELLTKADFYQWCGQFYGGGELEAVSVDNIKHMTHLYVPSTTI